MLLPHNVLSVRRDETVDIRYRHVFPCYEGTYTCFVVSHMILNEGACRNSLTRDHVMITQFPASTSTAFSRFIYSINFISFG
jgi:hypothetical protein